MDFNYECKLSLGNCCWKEVMHVHDKEAPPELWWRCSGESITPANTLPATLGTPLGSCGTDAVWKMHFTYASTFCKVTQQVTGTMMNRAQKNQSCNQRHPEATHGLLATQRPFVWLVVFSCDRGPRHCLADDHSARPTGHPAVSRGHPHRARPIYLNTQKQCLRNDKPSPPAFDRPHKSQSQTASHTKSFQ